MVGTAGVDNSGGMLARSLGDASSAIGGTLQSAQTQGANRQRQMWLSSFDGLGTALHRVGMMQDRKAAIQAEIEKRTFETNLSNQRLRLHNSISAYKAQIQQENKITPHLAGKRFEEGVEKNVVAPFFAQPQFEGQDLMIQELRQAANNQLMQFTPQMYDWGIEQGSKQADIEMEAVNKGIAMGPGNLGATTKDLFSAYDQLDARREVIAKNKGQAFANNMVDELAIEATFNFLNARAEEAPQNVIDILRQTPEQFTEHIRKSQQEFQGGSSVTSEDLARNLERTKRAVFAMGFKDRDRLINKAESKLQSNIKIAEAQQSAEYVSVKSKVISMMKDIPKDVTAIDPFEINKMRNKIQSMRDEVEKTPDSEDKVATMMWLETKDSQLEQSVISRKEKVEQEAKAAKTEARVDENYAEQQARKAEKQVYEKFAPQVTSVRNNLGTLRAQLSNKNAVVDGKMLSNTMNEVERIYKAKGMSEKQHASLVETLGYMSEMVRQRGATKDDPGVFQQLNNLMGGVFGKPLTPKAQEFLQNKTPAAKHAEDTLYNKLLDERIDKFKAAYPNIKGQALERAINKIDQDFQVEYVANPGIKNGR